MEKREQKVERCVACGICKAVCPSFLVAKDEKRSPRGRALIIKEGVAPDESFYDCTLCGACKESCYINISIPLRLQREKMVAAGKETEANRKMIANIRKYGNPFGKLEEGEEVKDLYCC